MKKIEWTRDDDGDGHIVLSAQLGPAKLWISKNGASPPHAHMKPGMWSWSSQGLGPADNVTGQSESEQAAIADLSDAVEMKVHEILIRQRRSLADLSELVEPSPAPETVTMPHVTMRHAPCACGWKPPRVTYLSMSPPAAIVDLAYCCPECGSRVNKSP